MRPGCYHISSQPLSLSLPLFRVHSLCFNVLHSLSLCVCFPRSRCTSILSLACNLLSRLFYIRSLNPLLGSFHCVIFFFGYHPNHRHSMPRYDTDEEEVKKISSTFQISLNVLIMQTDSLLSKTDAHLKIMFSVWWTPPHKSIKLRSKPKTSLHWKCRERKKKLRPIKTILWFLDRLFFSPVFLIYFWTASAPDRGF